jgi:hypothetical protein
MISEWNVFNRILLLNSIPEGYLQEGRLMPGLIDEECERLHKNIQSNHFENLTLIACLKSFALYTSEYIHNNAFYTCQYSKIFQKNL